MTSGTTNDPEMLCVRYKWHFWAHLAIGVLLGVAAFSSNDREASVGVLLLSLVSVTITAMLFVHSNRASGFVPGRGPKPDVGCDDSFADWHHALDKSGSLLIVWAVVIGGYLLVDVIDPRSFVIPQTVDAPLTGLMTVGGFFFALNDLRPALHRATQGRHRTDSKHRMAWTLAAMAFLFAVSLFRG